jgi:N-methylhydantoinase B
MRPPGRARIRQWSVTDRLLRLARTRYEGPSTEAGPQTIADPADYVDAPVVFRQYCCPSCWTALYSAVVPAGHTDTIASLGRLTLTPAR